MVDLGFVFVVMELMFFILWVIMFENENMFDRF